MQGKKEEKEKRKKRSRRSHRRREEVWVRSKKGGEEGIVEEVCVSRKDKKEMV